MTPLNAEHAEAKEAAWLHWSQGLPADVLPEARVAWESTIQAQGIDGYYAMQGFINACLALLHRLLSRWLR